MFTFFLYWILIFLFAITLRIINSDFIKSIPNTKDRIQDFVVLIINENPDFFNGVENIYRQDAKKIVYVVKNFLELLFIFIFAPIALLIQLIYFIIGVANIISKLIK